MVHDRSRVAEWCKVIDTRDGTSVSGDHRGMAPEVAERRLAIRDSRERPACEPRGVPSTMSRHLEALQVRRSLAAQVRPLSVRHSTRFTIIH